MRAGISALADFSTVDRSGERVVGAVVPGLALDLDPIERRLQLLEPALRECLASRTVEQVQKIPLLLGLSEVDGPVSSSGMAEGILPAIEQRLGARFLQEHSRAASLGRTAGLELLGEARVLIEEGVAPACLICGVDSGVATGALRWLEQRWRLRTSENADGVIPGEAAAAVLLESTPSRALARPVRVVGLGFAAEEATVMNEEPLLGLGLTQASKLALDEAGIEMHQIGFRISDLTGESYGFREQALVIGRLLRVHREEGYPLWHPSEYVGDTGAAAGVLQLAMAFHAYEGSYAPGKVAMCFTGTDRGRRAVALLASERAS